MTSKEQQEIITSILTNENSKALKYLYDYLLKKIRKYIIYNNGTKEEADDLFQDAILIFIHQVRQGKFDYNSNIDAFVFIIAKNLWLTRIRRDNRFQKYKQLMEGEERIEVDNQLKVILDKEKMDALNTAFHLLDEKCRNILHYVLYQKLSMKEICAKMGYASENVAKTNHYRCKKYLSEIVKKDARLLEILKE